MLVSPLTDDEAEEPAGLSSSPPRRDGTCAPSPVPRRLSLSVAPERKNSVERDARDPKAPSREPECPSTTTATPAPFDVQSPVEYDETAPLLSCWHPSAGIVHFHLLLDPLSQTELVEVRLFAPIAALNCGDRSR